jgi:hypothetical protein
VGVEDLEVARQQGRPLWRSESFTPGRGMRAKAKPGSASADSSGGLNGEGSQENLYQFRSFHRLLSASGLPITNLKQSQALGRFNPFFLDRFHDFVSYSNLSKRI